MIASINSQVQSSLDPPSINYFNQLINDVRSSFFINSESFEVAQTNEILEKKLQFPPIVIQLFKNIIFTDSLIFQSFVQTLSNQGASVTELIGCARKVNSTVQIGYVTVCAYGTTITQFDTYDTKDCFHLFWIFEIDCHTIHHKIVRAFTSSEMQIIFKGLRYYGFVRISQELPKPSTRNDLKIKLNYMIPKIFASNIMTTPVKPLILHASPPQNEGMLLLHQIIQIISEKIP